MKLHEAGIQFQAFLFLPSEMEFLRHYDPGELPRKTQTLIEQTSKLPKRMTVPLVLAQERLLTLDMQMEALLHERAEVVADMHDMGTRDGYQMLHHVIMNCLRWKLEDATAKAATAIMEREQELLLAEDRQAEVGESARKPDRPSI